MDNYQRQLFFPRPRTSALFRPTAGNGRFRSQRRSRGHARGESLPGTL
jgi:hypothetical protein